MTCKWQRLKSQNVNKVYGLVNVRAIGRIFQEIVLCCDVENVADGNKFDTRVL